MGKDVEFTDVIKAVSRSRSKEGCYFNFGAPYPKQVLFVWVPNEVYLSTPALPRFSRPAGPDQGSARIQPDRSDVVPSSDQFELLDVNDAVLAKSFLDGGMDREHFMAAVGQAFCANILRRSRSWLTNCRKAARGSGMMGRGS